MTPIEIFSKNYIDNIIFAEPWKTVYVLKFIEKEKVKCMKYEWHGQSILHNVNDSNGNNIVLTDMLHNSHYSQFFISALLLSTDFGKLKNQNITTNKLSCFSSLSGNWKYCFLHKDMQCIVNKQKDKVKDVRRDKVKDARRAIVWLLNWTTICRTTLMVSGGQKRLPTNIRKTHMPTTLVKK